MHAVFLVQLFTATLFVSVCEELMLRSLHVPQLILPASHVIISCGKNGQ